MNKKILSAENISFCYLEQKWQLENISAEFFSGDIVGIVGPNGAGKSTFIKIAAGILRPKAGNVFLNGKNIQNLSRKKIAAQLAYLPQNIDSIFNYTAAEAVLMGRFAHLQSIGFAAEKDMKIVKQYMQLTDTEKYQDRVLSHLSGGERQRVMLASVLCQQPEILLLDEPTTGLDLHHQVSFFELLAGLARDGLAVAVVTHDLNLAAMFCNKILLMNKGRIVKFDNVKNVLNEQVLDSVYPKNVVVDKHPAMSNIPIILPFTKRNQE